MFCPNCGNNLAEGAQYCSFCGKTIIGVAPVTQPAEPVGKTKYSFSFGPSKVKASSILSVLMTLALIGAMIGAYFSSVSTSIEEVPVVSAVIGLADVETAIDDAKADLAESIDEMEEELEQIDDFSQKEKKALNGFLGAIEDCVDALSVNNVITLAEATEEVADVMEEDLGEIDGIYEIVDFLKALRVIFLVMMVFALAFGVFGGFFRKRGLVVAGMVLTIIYTLLFAGWLWFGITLAIHIILIVFITIVNNSYKNYLIQAKSGILVG